MGIDRACQKFKSLLNISSQTILIIDYPWIAFVILKQYHPTTQHKNVFSAVSFEI